MNRSAREDVAYYWSLMRQLLGSAMVFMLAVAINYGMGWAMRELVGSETIVYQWAKAVFDILLLGTGILTSAASLFMGVWASVEPVVALWPRSDAQGDK